MYKHRFLEGALRSTSSESKVRMIFGARQTGKTFLLSHLASDQSWISFNLQDRSLRLAWEADPRVFTSEIHALPRHIRHVVVDEIQKVPALLDEIQALYDKDKTQIQFYLTGSSARRLRTHSANLLPGRSHVFHLYPLIRPEIGGLVMPRSPAISIKQPSGDSRLMKRVDPFGEWSLDDELLFGALPGIRLESRASRTDTLTVYVENYLEEEIRREALVRDVGAFSNFIRLAAAESGRITNLAKLSQESGIPAATLKNFYLVLQDTFVGFTLHPYSRSVRRRLLTTPRVYFFDLGVRNAAARIPMEPGTLAIEGGPLLEQWVGLELMRRARYAGAGFGVSFWRTTDGAEVDFVWQTPREDIPIEVKWTLHPTVSDARHLRTFLDLHRPRARRAFLVCRCRAPMDLGCHVLAIPWNHL